ncbi:hypothetical protein Esti_002388 [Eimeria stiedai]
MLYTPKTKDKEKAIKKGSYWVLLQLPLELKGKSECCACTKLCVISCVLLLVAAAAAVYFLVPPQAANPLIASVQSLFGKKPGAGNDRPAMVEL